MRKPILLIVCSSCFFGTLVSAQQKKSKSSAGITPFTEVLYGLGLCGESNAFSFTGGIEKPAGPHWTISTDIHYWKTDYETYCCDVYSKGTYSSVIPSVKIKFDPGKKQKGFFIGAGIGYVFARDRGTEQTYTYNSSTGTGIVGKDVVQGNWDFNGIAPSFNWGVGFRISRLPVSLVNTNYFAQTPWGFGPISTGIGLRVGFRKIPNDRKCRKSCAPKYNGGQ